MESEAQRLLRWTCAAAGCAALFAEQRSARCASRRRGLCLGAAGSPPRPAWRQAVRCWAAPAAPRSSYGRPPGRGLAPACPAATSQPAQPSPGPAPPPPTQIPAGCRGWTTDVCVPPSRLTECIVAAQARCAARGLTAPLLGHVGDGNFHMVILVDPGGHSAGHSAGHAAGRQGGGATSTWSFWWTQVGTARDAAGDTQQGGRGGQGGGESATRAFRGAASGSEWGPRPGVVPAGLRGGRPRPSLSSSPLFRSSLHPRTPLFPPHPLPASAADPEERESAEQFVDEMVVLAQGMGGTCTG